MEKKNLLASDKEVRLISIELMTEGIFDAVEKFLNLEKKRFPTLEEREAAKAKLSDLMAKGVTASFNKYRKIHKIHRSK